MDGRKRVLVTGAAGRVGTAIAPALADRHDLVQTDVRPQRGIDALDLLDFDAVRAAAEGVDAIVHMAILSDRVNQHLSMQERADRRMTMNVLSTQHVFEAARQAGARQVVFFSSLLTILGAPRRQRIERNPRPRPSNLYACTKLFGEHLADLYTRTNDISIICARLGQPFPIDDIGFEEGGQHRIGSAESGICLAMEDVARFVLCALDAEHAGFEVMNLVSANEVEKVDLTAAAEIGYRPGRHFDRKGRMRVLDDA